MDVLQESAMIVERRWRDLDSKPVVVVGERLYVAGPGGLGTEDPDTSEWCTRDPETCEMLVCDGTTKARVRLAGGAQVRHPDGTCMLLPPMRCKHLKEAGRR